MSLGCNVTYVKELYPNVSWSMLEYVFYTRNSISDFGDWNMKKNVEILETPGFTRVLSSKFSSCFMGRWFGMKEPLLPKPRRGEEPQIRVFTWAKKRHLKNLYSNEYVSFIYISDSCPINELISNIIQFFSHHGASNQSLYAILFCPISFPKCFPMVPDPRMAAQLLLNQLRDIGVLLQRRVRHLRSEQKASHGHIWDGRFFLFRSTASVAKKASWNQWSFCCAVNGMISGDYDWTYKNHAEMMFVNLKNDPWDDLKQKQV